jgi:hypothetical protein
MRRRQFGWAALLGLAAVGQARALTLPAAHIVSATPDGTASVFRADGSRSGAKPGMPLYSGDRIEIVGADAVVNVAVQDDIRTLFATDSPFFVKGSSLTLSPQEEEFFDSYSDYLSQPYAEVATYGRERGPNGPGYTPGPSRMTPPGKQYLLPGISEAVVVWRDGPGRLFVTPDGRDDHKFEVDSGTSAWARIPLAGNAQTYAIEMQFSKVLRWDLQLIDEVDAKHDGTLEKLLTEIRDPRGQNARLTWATQALVPDRPQYAAWHVCAASMVWGMVRSGITRDPVGKLWNGVISDEPPVPNH